MRFNSDLGLYYIKIVAYIVKKSVKSKIYPTYIFMAYYCCTCLTRHGVIYFFNYR